MCGAFNIISVLEIHSYEMKTLRKTRNAPLKDYGYLELCLYDLGELVLQHHDLNQSEHSIPKDPDQ